MDRLGSPPELQGPTNDAPKQPAGSPKDTSSHQRQNRNVSGILPNGPGTSLGPAGTCFGLAPSSPGASQQPMDPQSTLPRSPNDIRRLEIYTMFNGSLYNDYTGNQMFVFPLWGSAAPDSPHLFAYCATVYRPHRIYILSFLPSRGGAPPPPDPPSSILRIVQLYLDYMGALKFEFAP